MRGRLIWGIYTFVTHKAGIAKGVISLKGGLAKGSTLILLYSRMWDKSVLIRRCENFGLFHSLCSELVEASERQTMA